MYRSARRLLTTGLVLAVSIGAATACTATASPSAAPSTSTPSVTEPPATAEPARAYTCEDVITDEFLADLTTAGWKSHEDTEPWVLGGAELEGVSCKWAEQIGTDNFVWAAWAPIDDAHAAAAIAELTGSGEFSQDPTPDGVYVTMADAQYAPVRDQNGYSVTYLFADGFVLAAMTRADLQQVRVPEGWKPAA